MLADFGLEEKVEIVRLPEVFKIMIITSDAVPISPTDGTNSSHNYI